MARSRSHGSMALALLFVASSLGVAHAQPTPTPSVTDTPPASVSLHDALAAMLARHPLLESSRALVRAAEGDARDAALWTNPVVDGTWNPGLTHNSYDAIGYFSFGVTQFFELAGAPRARGDAARRVTDAVRAEASGIVLALSLEVEASLITLFVAERRVEVLGRALTMMEDVERIIRARAAAGAAPDYDVMRIAIAIALSRADVASAEADARRARGAFESAVGPGSATLRGAVTYALEDAPTLPAIDVLVARQRASHPDVVSADRRLDAARLTVTATSRSVFPGVGVRLGGGFGASPGQWDLGLGVTVPIPAIDHGQGAVRAAEARVAVQQGVAESIAFGAERRLRARYDEVTERREALAGYASTATPAQTRMLDEAKVAYEAGRMSVLELADAFEAWRDAQLRALDLAADARLAEVELARELGALLASE